MGIWGHSRCCWKALNESDLIYFKIFRPKVWKILIFLVNFVVENSNIELQKLGLEGKIN